MEKKTDLRIQKTHLALTNSFWELLKKKKFEDITVNELCSDAMVRRATFYKHFADKYEFFSFIINQIQESYDAQCATSGKEDERNTYIGIIRHTFDFLCENEQVVNSVLTSSASPILFELLSERISFDVREKLKNDVKNGVELNAAPEIMAQLFTGALLNIAIWWIKQGKRISRADIEEQVTKLLMKI